MCFALIPESEKREEINQKINSDLIKSTNLCLEMAEKGVGGLTPG